MKFKLENTFEDNLALFRAEAVQIDPECAKILFDNLHLLDSGGDTAPSRATIGEFHKAVLDALDGMSIPLGEDKA
ncbi:hypothetical protein ACVIW2_006447 [Bradyrhizobium huanghuaihaiense]|jgi:hypothetical protein|uniref:Transcriptional regulator n=6 Tax=Bradyrhizobium TaxID=374 RepID=A0A0M9B8K5_BRAJP|nr:MULTISPECIES: hypothetical protein [Bradyrhizobium]AHY56415.1 hypothetical protein BJS_07673 [Bradyrhizobium japonicum SEMIA 5079]AJA66158.1 hypothetical protein RN69_42410 [Bradyrhizobium japonicum]AND93009.1 hypothetical protein AAV28_38585 [Bradyrhizobium diazoefficiens USDA 110]APG15875.1 hypothetical protein BKD09_47080 [Bradyrhizobium japonicum]APO56989.1 hypothetical protein BD122_41885 [Bradyrhizobium diazoefficiens]